LTVGARERPPCSWCICATTAGREIREKYPHGWRVLATKCCWHNDKGRQGSNGRRKLRRKLGRAGR